MKSSQPVTKPAGSVTEPADDVTGAACHLPDDVLNGMVSAIEQGYAAGADLADEDVWTRELVMDRLEEAIKLVHRTAGRVGPRGYGSSMPAYIYSELDLWYQQTQTDEERAQGDFERNRVRRPATTEQIRQAEEALEWPRRFVAHEQTRKALLLWMMSKALRVPFKQVLKTHGIAHRTGIARRDRAVAVIVYGLEGQRQPQPQINIHNFRDAL